LFERAGHGLRFLDSGPNWGRNLTARVAGPAMSRSTDHRADHGECAKKRITSDGAVRRRVARSFRGARRPPDRASNVRKTGSCASCPVAKRNEFLPRDVQSPETSRWLTCPESKGVDGSQRTGIVANGVEYEVDTASSSPAFRDHHRYSRRLRGPGKSRAATACSPFRSLSLARQLQSLHGMTRAGLSQPFFNRLHSGARGREHPPDGSNTGRTHRVQLISEAIATPRDYRRAEPEAQTTGRLSAKHR